MTSPQDRAFGLPEILEYILSYLKEYEILVNAQRVSKHWKAVIESSPILQQALLFQESPGTKVGSQYTQNSLLKDVIPSLFVAFEDFDALHSLAMPRRANLNAISNDAKNIKGWFADGASWRRMQVAQPPITKVWMVIGKDGRYSGGPFAVFSDFEFPEGLRMGTYYDLAVGTRGSHSALWPRHVCHPLPPTEIDHTIDGHQYWPYAFPNQYAAEDHGALVIWKCRSWMEEFQSETEEDRQLLRSVDLRQFSANLNRLCIFHFMQQGGKWTSEYANSDSVNRMGGFMFLFNQ
ncbi:hypothetical protein F5Y04DRAFT_287880 [Hypomontagnella monticulosa]|nr:hypothetical protein F5Y04DRAFT_287880 [Hypomontagnella monticulosa]